MLRIAVAAALAGALGACSAVPVAGTFPVTLQQKMQSAGHWQVLADDVALSLKARAPSDSPIFVENAGNSLFGDGFRSYLETALYRQGVAVATGPGGASVVHVEVEGVRHHGARDIRPPPGFFTLLGGGVWLGEQASTHWTGNGFAAAPAIGAILDVFDMASVRPTNTEIIVTIQASSSGQTVYRDTRTYYVPDGDIALYEPAPSSPAGPAPGSVRVGDLLIPPGGCVASQCQIVHSY